MWLLGIISNRAKKVNTPKNAIIKGNNAAELVMTNIIETLACSNDDSIQQNKNLL